MKSSHQKTDHQMRARQRTVTLLHLTTPGQTPDHTCGAHTFAALPLPNPPTSNLDAASDLKSTQSMPHSDASGWALELKLVPRTLRRCSDVAAPDAMCRKDPGCSGARVSRCMVGRSKDFFLRFRSCFERALECCKRQPEDAVPTYEAMAAKTSKAKVDRARG
jgi:hypothetical protein